MRPKVEYADKERLIRIARDVGELPEDRDVSFGEALEAVLDHLEANRGQQTAEDSQVFEQAAGSVFEAGQQQGRRGGSPGSRGDGFM